MKVTTTPAALAALVKAVAPAASKDKYKPHLARVLVASSTDTFTMTATDGYRAHLVSAMHAGDSVGEFGEVLVPASALAALAKTVTKYAKTPSALVTINDNDTPELTVSVLVNGSPVMSEVLPQDPADNFPFVAAIFDDARVASPDEVPALSVGLSPMFMCAAFTAADVIAAGGVVTMRPLRERKPAYISAYNADTLATFEAVVMPQRIK